METEVISGHKTLLQKYEIPLEHLDFDYLRTCTETKKVERILTILRSGEEGYFPDLTKFAENRLRELDPKSKLLRVEASVLRKSNLKEDARKDLESGIKTFHESITKPITDTPLIRNLPPIRTLKKEMLDTFDKETSKNDTKPHSSRIKSHEYDKWDKFDAEAEELKVDLDQERKIEMHKQREKSRKNQDGPVIEEIYEDDFKSMTDKERQVLALRCKDKGNDYYRAKEYDEAIEEYTKSLRIFPMAATFNNRAIAYIKTQDYHKVVKDCDKCLDLEPDNIKALLRKGQALQGLDQRRDAYEIYCKVLLIEPNNTVALNLVDDLRKQLPDLPLPNSTRIKIVDEDGSDVVKESVKAVKNDTTSQKMIITQETSNKSDSESKIVPITTTKNTEKSHLDTGKPKEDLTQEGTVKAASTVIQKKIDPKDQVLSNYKMKLQEEKKKKQEYKEHFKQMFEGVDDVFLLPHHNKKNQEFIIEESKE